MEATISKASGILCGMHTTEFFDIPPMTPVLTLSQPVIIVGSKLLMLLVPRTEQVVFEFI